MVIESSVIYLVNWNQVDGPDHGQFRCETIQAVDQFLTELERKYTFTGYRHHVHPVFPMQYHSPSV